MRTESTASKLGLQSLYDFVGIGLFAADKFSSVLLVEDDRDYGELLKTLLEANSEIRVKLTEDPYEAIDFLTERCYDLVIADWALPPLNASNAIRQADQLLKMDPLLPIQWSKKRIPVVLISGEDHTIDIKGFRSMEHFEFAQFLLKQSGVSKIVSRVKKILAQRSLKVPKSKFIPVIH